MRKLLLPTLAVCLLGSPAGAQVLITEVQPNPNGSDDAEWIELHNTGSAAVNIGGYRINDFGPTPPREFEFPVGTTLAAGQVIVVARQAAAYTAMALIDLLPVTTPDFELADGADDMAVPNLSVAVSGGGGFGLANSGDGVQLTDGLGAVLSTAEWGNGRTEVPGNPAAGPGSGESISRIANTGSSDVDFVVLTTPTPGTGFSGPMPTPPNISNVQRSPAVFVHGGTFDVSADVVDADGVGGVEVYFATATAPTGAANGSYVAVSAVPSMSTYSVSGRSVAAPATGLTVPAPTAFNQQYIRYFVYALDNVADEATDPPMAVTGAANPSYHWENVLPATGTTPIATARAQNASELPIWDGHSVRIEGVALTTIESFLNGRTNFFVADDSMGAVEAIRIYDDDLIRTAINPGDRVVVTGKVGAFRGVRQVGRDERGAVDAPGPEITVQVMGTASVPMHTVTIANLLASGEQYESSLVEIVNCAFASGAPATWPSDGNVDVTDGTGTLTVRVVGVTDLANAVAPSGGFSLRGILTQFAPSGTGGYQLQPRGLADVLTGVPPVDGGTPVDAGNPLDGGASPDASAPPDSGPTGPDASMPPVDAGPMADTGVPPADTGVPPADTGVPPADAGVPPFDAGVVVDSGVAPDSGLRPPPPDSGIYGGNRGDPRDSGGCTCAAPRAAAPGWSLGLLAALTLGVVRRRR